MKKITTQSAGHSGNPNDGCRAASPRKSTIAFLKQFARTYAPGPSTAYPGFVLN